MSTVVLNAYTKAYPSITNRIRASVLDWSGVTTIASIIDTTVGHPARTYSFAGLPRDNYYFTLDEIDISGNPLANLALFDVVPGELEGQIVRDDEQYQVDAALSGMTSGLQVSTFDGTGGVPDFTGWVIVPSIYGDARGILVLGVDYSWNEVTGVFTLLQTGDVWQAGAWVHFHFNPKANTAGTSVPSLNDFSIRLVTATGAILYEDFGNIILSEPATVYIELQLPLASTIPVGRELRIDFGGTGIACTRILPNASDSINWLRGRLFGYSNESIIIYRYQRSVGNDEWRVRSVNGQFESVGSIVSYDNISAGLFNVQLMDGSSKLATQYARLYNEVVLNLPLTQVCNYDDWSTGNNRYLFSIANSANPIYAGQFKFPDRRGIFEKNNNTGKAGDYQDDAIITHEHEQTVGTLPTAVNGRGLVVRTIGQYNGTHNVVTDLTGPPVSSAGVVITKVGSENLVKNYTANKYILI